MPKAGAFDKAKVKKSGGFGASKSGRFDGPKESCDYAPSAGAYNTYDFGTIGGRVKADQSKASFARRTGGATGGFGSSAKRESGLHGQRNDAPGPGAYADAHKSTFEKKKKRLSRSSTFGSGSQHEVGAATPSAYTPAPGEYAAPTGVGSVGKHKGKSNGFGFSKRFEDPPEVVQADYAVASAFDDTIENIE